MQQPDLSLHEVILLDRIQKGLPINRDEHQQLKKQKLVEGRFPHLIVSASMARATGEMARHIRESGLDKQYYLDLILKLIRQHGPVARQEVDALLLPKLPERLTEEQKQAKVHNLLQELRRAGRIERQGPRAAARWILQPGPSAPPSNDR
jgi:ATP-dependent DNA helicase RecG